MNGELYGHATYDPKSHGTLKKYREHLIDLYNLKKGPFDELFDSVENLTEEKKRFVYNNVLDTANLIGQINFDTIATDTFQNAAGSALLSHLQEAMSPKCIDDVLECYMTNCGFSLAKMDKQTILAQMKEANFFSVLYNGHFQQAVGISLLTLFELHDATSPSETTTKTESFMKLLGSDYAGMNLTECFLAPTDGEHDLAVFARKFNNESMAFRSTCHKYGVQLRLFDADAGDDTDVDSSDEEGSE